MSDISERLREAADRVAKRAMGHDAQALISIPRQPYDVDAIAIEAADVIDALEARATAAEADIAFLRRRRGELVIQRDEARQKGRANWCAWREALADAETWMSRATFTEAALAKAREALRRVREEGGDLVAVDLALGDDNG
jgi:hypothetical protein